jgi:hypothetical protein
MREIISILSASLAATALLQGYVAMKYSSDSGFAEFLALLVSTICLVAVSFVVLVLPTFIWLRRTQHQVSWFAGFVGGFVLGVFVMFILILLFHWPVRIPLLVASSIAGAVGVSIYARLIFKRVA